MIEAIKGFWYKLSNNGITDNLDPSEKRRIRLLNITTFLILDISLFFLLLDLSLKMYEPIIIVLIAISTLFIILYLIKKHYFLTAKLLSFLFILGYIFSTFLLVGANTGNLLYLIPLMLYPTVIFRKKITIYICSLIVIIIYFILKLWSYNYSPYLTLEENESEIYYYVSILIIMIISFLIIWYFKRENIEYEHIIINNNLRLTEANKKVENQKIILQEKNKAITDSINYARRIQNAILPSRDIINSVFPDSFILYLPKDIVAGDFYWTIKTDTHFYFAVADCTGHGVPGAMLSVMCHNALNKTITVNKLTQTNDILYKTKSIIVETFDATNKDIYDGMDICLCSYNFKTKNIQFSGANNNLIRISNNKELFEYKGDRQSIGLSDNNKAFSPHNIEANTGDCFYLYSDGYIDQFGGVKGKKLKLSKFKDILLSNYSKSMKLQKTEINKSFESWKGKAEQIDDICVMGIKI
jgi:serine phosphatase RsbU (regulator of sigma subunit)